MKAARLMIVVLILAGTLVWWSDSTRDKEAQHVAAATPSDAAQTRIEKPVEILAASKIRRESAPQTAIDKQTEPGHSSQNVYRLSLEGDQCSLVAVEQVVGDFGRRRSLQWQSGMICCRLVDSHDKVLAEQTLPAPDHTCVVLDPNLPAPDGKPQAAALTPEGPAVFQVRFPPQVGAAAMKIYRLAGSRAPTGNAEPLGQQLASIPLPNP